MHCGFDRKGPGGKFGGSFSSSRILDCGGFRGGREHRQDLDGVAKSFWGGQGVEVEATEPTEPTGPTGTARDMS